MGYLLREWEGLRTTWKNVHEAMGASREGEVWLCRGLRPQRAGLSPLSGLNSTGSRQSLYAFILTAS